MMEPEAPPFLWEQIMTTPFFDTPADDSPEIDITPAWSTGGQLAGTVALVTGASSGIGAATALALADRGAAVALAARRRDRLEKLASSIQERGGTAVFIEADITDEEQARQAIDLTIAELGRLDTLINNAGVMLLGPAAGAPLSEWQRMVDLNVMGLLYTAHAALPHLLTAAESDPRRVADMVNVSSVAGRIARAGRGVYNLTKHGIGAFSESFRQEFSRRHLRVGVVEPGAVQTELRDHLRPEIRRVQAERMAAMDPLVPDDVADAVRYIVTRPRRQMVNEVLLRPTDQDD
jgi:NADP-dependent 3-hydroxy acid dehydrogenase YdfG